ncbi:hypothetical protein HMPREF0262_03291 [Clostridium sp. ATCC 29733]|nr:hypothetical protein HMPREF0262_03291 [Clostridium sp. ATCC 29733]
MRQRIKSQLPAARPGGEGRACTGGEPRGQTRLFWHPMRARWRGEKADSAPRPPASGAPSFALFGVQPPPVYGIIAINRGRSASAVCPLPYDPKCRCAPGPCGVLSGWRRQCRLCAEGPDPMCTVKEARGRGRL